MLLGDTVVLFRVLYRGLGPRAPLLFALTLNQAGLVALALLFVLFGWPKRTEKATSPHFALQAVCPRPLKGEKLAALKHSPFYAPSSTAWKGYIKERQALPN